MLCPLTTKKQTIYRKKLIINIKFLIFSIIRTSIERSDDLERYRAGQLRAEHLLKAREQSHRQQVQHLKNEVNKVRGDQKVLLI